MVFEVVLGYPKPYTLNRVQDLGFGVWALAGLDGLDAEILGFR